MGNLTRYIGGQTVTTGSGDSAVSGERQFRMVNALPGSPESGVIYLTPSEIANSNEITGYELISSGSLGNGAGSFNVRVTGDEESQFSITGSNGASNVGNTTIPIGETFVDVSVGVTAQAISAPQRFPRALLVPNPASNPETVFAEGFSATNPIQVTQAAGLLPRNLVRTTPNYTYTWDGGDTGIISVGINVLVDQGPGFLVGLVAIGGVNYEIQQDGATFISGGGPASWPSISSGGRYTVLNNISSGNAELTFTFRVGANDTYTSATNSFVD